MIKKSSTKSFILVKKEWENGRYCTEGLGRLVVKVPRLETKEITILNLHGKHV